MNEKKIKPAGKRHSAFSVGLIAIAVAVTVLFNLLAAQLPASIKQFDMTNSGIYNITDTTRSITSSSVWGPRTTSTRGRIWAGANQCAIRVWLCLPAGMKEKMSRAEVLLAMITPGSKI